MSQAGAENSADDRPDAEELAAYREALQFGPVTPRERAIEALDALHWIPRQERAGRTADAVLTALREDAVERVHKALVDRWGDPSVEDQEWAYGDAIVAVAALLGADPTPTTEET